MMILAAAILALAYLGILWQLVGTPIPSEASSYQILANEDGNKTSPEISEQRSRSMPTKTLIFLLPVFTSVLFLSIPWIVLLFPKARMSLWPVVSSSCDLWLLIGSVVALSGTLISTIAAYQLFHSRQSNPESLYAMGLFSFSRNPIVLGITVFYAGVAISGSSWLLVLGFFLFVVNLHRRILLEETHLVDMFGPQFTHYARKVPRYFLRLPPWKTE